MAHLRRKAVMSKQTPDVMTLNEVADYLRIPRSTVYKLVREGRIPGQKIGRQWRFRRKVVENWLGDTESQEHGKTQEQQ
jgi:excisionase family DNA binding protein